LAYMSPEQLTAILSPDNATTGNVDGRSDIYSLGVLLWELLSAKNPFNDETMAKSWFQFADTMILNRRHCPSTVGFPPDTPTRLVQILKQCLAPTAEKRWSSAAELAREMDLCRMSRALKIVYPEHRKMIRKVPIKPLFVLTSLSAIPNIIAGWINYTYNYNQIVLQLPPITQSLFWSIQLVINAIAYPLGLGLFSWLVYSVVDKDCNSHESCNLSYRSELVRERRILQLGHYAAMISIGFWSVAGITYPTSLHVIGGDFPLSAYPHFFLSLFICGLASAVYVYFTISAASIRICYAALVRANSVQVDHAALTFLRKQSSAYLFVAALIPITGLYTLHLLGSDSRFAVTVLGLCGILGFALIYLLFWRIRHDANALLQLSPHRDSARVSCLP